MTEVSSDTNQRDSLSHEGSPVKPQMSVEIGEVIRGKYRVDRVIGEGGMGVVVAATHLTLDRTVAIKLLNAKSSESDEALERFTREARAAARIQSEHVGRVLDVDTLPTGAPFIVMEYLDGHDLAGEMRDGKKLDRRQAVVYVLQACEAVAEAHAGGIVHRDLKPANLFLARTGSGSTTVKVLAFNDFHGNLQSPGSFAGVPAGGVDYLAGYVASLKAQNPNNVVVAAGDLIGASPLISAFFHDEGTIETLNRLGLEIAADQIVTSGSLLPAYFRGRGLAGARTLVLGTADSSASGGAALPLWLAIELARSPATDAATIRPATSNATLRGCNFTTPQGNIGWRWRWGSTFRGG